MDITEFTSYAEVRLLMGVSPQEMPDGDMSLPIVGYWLNLAFEDVYPGLVDAYRGWLEADPGTAAEQRAIMAVRVYSAYVVAAELRGATGSSMLKSITDGRAKEERFGPVKDDWQMFLDRLNRARQALIDALVALGLLDPVAPATPRVFFGSAGLAVDPVVGEDQ